MNSIKLGKNNHWATIFFTACFLTPLATRYESHFKRTLATQRATTEHKTMWFSFCAGHLERKPHGAFHSAATAENWTHQAWWKSFYSDTEPEATQWSMGSKKTWYIWQINMSMNIFLYSTSRFKVSCLLSFRIQYNIFHYKWYHQHCNLSEKITLIKHVSYTKKPLKWSTWSKLSWKTSCTQSTTRLIDGLYFFFFCK